MSSLTNNNNIAQSMNGLISITSNDITSDTITANTITTTDLYATNLTLTNSTLQNLTTNLSATLKTLTTITGVLNIGTSILGVATAYFGNFTIGAVGSALSQLTVYAQTWFYDNIYFYNTSGLKRTIFYVSTIAMDDTSNSGSPAVQANLARNGGLIISDNTQMTLRQGLTEKIKFTATQTDVNNDVIINTAATSHTTLIGANPKITIVAGTTTYANTTHNITGTTTSLNTNSGTVNLGTGGTSTTNVNVMTGATPTGTLTIGRPITTSYLPSSITVNTQIGYQGTITGTSLVTMPTTNGSIATLVTLPAGVWSINVSAQLGSNTAGTFIALTLNSSNTVTDNSRRQHFYPPGGFSGLYYNVNSIFSVSASTTFYLWGLLSSGSMSTTGVTGYYTRIA